MKKNKPKTMGKNIDRDVELCRTPNARVSSQMMRIYTELGESSIL